MANSNTPQGLQGVNENGQYVTPPVNIYYVPTGQGALYLGDPLIPLGGSDANGIPSVGIASAGAGDYLVGSMVGIVSGGDPVIGIFQGSPIYHPASTAGYILVADNPGQTFLIQEDSVGGALTSTSAAWSNANLVSGSGSTVTGFSGWQLQSSSGGSSGNPTYQLRILRLLQRADNAIGVNAKWIVRINLHSLSNANGI